MYVQGKCGYEIPANFYGQAPVEITLPESQYIGDVQTFLREQLVDALRQINRGFEYYCSDAILLARSVRRVDGQPGRGYVPELVMMSSYFGGDVRHLYELLGGPNLWLILYRGTASPHLQRMQGYGADA